MTEQNKNNSEPQQVDEAELEALVASADTGARKPQGFTHHLIIWTAVVWSLFQLWIASPLPYMVADYLPVLNNTDTRSAHLAFAFFLAFLAYPAMKSSPRSRVPLPDWVFGIVGAACALYLSVFARDLAERPGIPTPTDLGVAIVGLVLLLEAARRSLGPPLMIIASIFLAYVFFGHLAPEVIAWKGASMSKAMSHMWITQEGVFGIALGVSTSMVFLFVLFGSLLERAGAGNYFIWVAFSLLGHLRGGPAKAAVVSSAMTGLVSGSSIANVVTTGTFTIPLMRKIGFPAEKAGAVEVASSTNGQLTPPVMGAAAFLMIEFIGISYVEVIKHAFLPAIISYIALVYIVHLEACKAGMKGLPRQNPSTFLRALFSFMTVLVGLLVITAVVYFGLGWIKDVFGDNALWVISGLLIAVYLALLKLSTYYPELGHIDEIETLPPIGPVAKSGFYFLLPVVVLVWCLTVERLSPGLAAFWATVAMILVLLTHKRFKAILRGDRDKPGYWMEGLVDLREGLVAGARNMISIGIATAAAGIIIGTVTLTGVGLVMAEVVEFISGGNLIVMLFLTAGISLLLGMGLPTTANYIVVSSLMAPVIVSLGAEAGLIVPLVAVHLFVFYFGILADDTPPVGLAAYAAAAISGGDPIKTGLQGFGYDIRTAVLPFMFIFNTELLMIGIEGPLHLILVVASAVTAMLIFAAATQGWWFTKNKLWETAIMLLVAFTLVRPGFWMDMIYPPLIESPAANIYEVAESLPENAQIRVQVVGETLEGDPVDKIVMLPVGKSGDGLTRIREAAGMELREEKGKLLVDNLVFGGAAEKQKIDFDWEIKSVQVKAVRPAKQWFFIPAILLLLLVWKTQSSRARRELVKA